MPNEDFELNEDFFSQIEDELLGGSEDDEPANPGNESGNTDDIEKLKKELETLKKRYADSSREAKRLYQELQSIKPVVEQLKQNPDAVAKARNILEGNTPENIMQQLGLPEDFVFDFEEALSNPSSDSAKALHSVVDAIVSNRVEQITSEKELQSKIRDELERFKERHKLSDDEMNDLIEWSKEHQLSMEDIWYLRTREQRERQIAKRAVEEFKKQLKKMGNLPHSLSGLATPDTQTADKDKAVFDLIKKSLGYAIE